MTCIVCKKFRIPSDSSRSFHRFPKNDDLKMKWINAIGKYSIKKNSIICSDHFDARSYHETNEYTHLRRLLPNAVPRMTSNKEELLDVTNKCTETSDKNVSEYFQSTESQNIKITKDNKINNSEENTQTLVSECIVNVNSVNSINQGTINNSNDKSDDPESDYPYLTISPLETVEHAPYIDLKLSHDEIIRKHLQCHQDNNGNCNKIKRKIPFKNKTHHTEIKTINYRCNFQTYHFGREKFSSDKAWAEFQEFSTSLKNKKAAVLRKQHRNQKKLANLRMVIKKLKRANEINIAEYLQVVYRKC